MIDTQVVCLLQFTNFCVVFSVMCCPGTITSTLCLLCWLSVLALMHVSHGAYLQCTAQNQLSSAHHCCWTSLAASYRSKQGLACASLHTNVRALLLALGQRDAHTKPQLMAQSKSSQLLEYALLQAQCHHYGTTAGRQHAPAVGLCRQPSPGLWGCPWPR